MSLDDSWAGELDDVALSYMYRTYDRLIQDNHRQLKSKGAIEGTPRGRAWFIPGRRELSAPGVSMTTEQFEAFTRQHSITWEEA